MSCFIRSAAVISLVILAFHLFSVLQPAQCTDTALPEPALIPVYRIPLRVHLGKSGRSPLAFEPILHEINQIWLSQAGICFEIQVVLDDERGGQGMDIWFLPALPAGEELNGYYGGDHEIQVRDTPLLGPAQYPARFPAARTAAHEFGHGLDLPHRQDSDDNLMRSKTQGWRLNAAEVAAARKAAAEKALPAPGPLHCGPPRMPIPDYASP